MSCCQSGQACPEPWHPCSQILVGIEVSMGAQLRWRTGVGKLQRRIQGHSWNMLRHCLQVSAFRLGRTVLFLGGRGLPLYFAIHISLAVSPSAARLRLPASLTAIRSTAVMPLTDCAIRAFSRSTCHLPQCIPERISSPQEPCPRRPRPRRARAATLPSATRLARSSLWWS